MGTYLKKVLCTEGEQHYGLVMSTKEMEETMPFDMDYECELPIEFCGRIIDYVRCDLLLECRFDHGQAIYDIHKIQLTDFNGDYYEPSGEDVDMIDRMVRKMFDSKICAMIYDQDEWDRSCIKGTPEWSVYA
jgi:hypothetical protein